MGLAWLAADIVVTINTSNEIFKFAGGNGPSSYAQEGNGADHECNGTECISALSFSNETIFDRRFFRNVETINMT